MKVNKAVDKRTQRNTRQRGSSERVNAAKDKARRVGLRLQGAARDGVVVALLAVCTFLLLALFSYSPSDPGWSSQGPETAVDNWMGPVGAWLADVLYSLLGASALWWPGMVGYLAWWLVRSRQVRFELDPIAVAVRAGGLMLLMFGTTMLGALHFYNPDSVLPYASGGILGEGLVGALRPLVSSGGVGLIAAALILSGFPLFSGMSWLQVADEVGRRLCRLGGWWSARRQARRERVRQRAAARPTPAPSRRSAVAEEAAPANKSASEPADKPEPSAKPRRREPGLSSPSADDQAGDAKAVDAPAQQVDATDTSIPWSATGQAPSANAFAATPSSLKPEPEEHEVTPPAEQAEPSAAEAPSPSPATEPEVEAPSTPQDNATEPTPTSPFAAPPATDEAPEPSEALPLRASRRHEEEGVEAPDAASATPLSTADDDTDDDEAVAPPLNAERPRTRVPEVVPEPVWDDDDDEPEAVSPARHEPAFRPEAVEEVGSDDGPTLWTVEHLQNQRPAYDDIPDPEGDVPSLRLLTPAEPHQPNYSDEQLADMAELLEVRLREYGVKAEVVDTWPGPVITRFEIKPAAGVKVSKISNLAKDLARSLMVKSVRVVEVIPGRPTVGIEIPNPHRAMIRLREVIDSERYQQETSPLTMALGQDIGGGPVVANLGKMPHLLVAGTTGSGKSVGVNAMLISMLLKATPDELKLIMVDPKMLELSVYDGIPHLLAPVVTDMKEAANSLRWCVAEMERRYKLMAAMGVRNIAGFNARLDEAERAGAQVADPLWEPQPWEMHQTPPILEKLPYIVVVIDEFADMFMIVGKKVEELIARLAQKARAAGIHLILATQRPSVDVVTGLIKANIPSRMAFQVSSRIDSRTILDQGGAESLLGHGDMLYLPAGSGPPNRIHGAFVDDDEVHRVVDDWKRRGEPEYIEEILSGGVTADALAGLEAEGGDSDDAEQDALYDEAVQFVTQTRKASISAVQRRFKIGYNRAARLVEAMEGAGVVSNMGTNGAREVLAPPPAGQ
ncbi:DNA translocase FtsK 4TM domain-containing protein [Halomonas sp. CUBES01]|uniref:DNA translocase FtsK n=1 Tax=Vreelandella gomseomensis TaxID=370766 RepID=A0ABU1GG51_9GAMM|nr:MULTISPECIES: DNA translocase FtsK [Halomonas]MDR5876441.1 DNA translocase FtsK 4TM domain-containing protein [Halomonas gomseomensis]MEC4766799.1 DNA translocase FtsK 4TM domain-containing protein [Halomonas sp. CUBES01]